MRLAVGFVGLVLLALAGTAMAAPTDVPQPPPARPKLGLVLSGGGARGLAHVGVLKVLERERIPVDLIAGTSMGSIIGGLYASGMTSAELERELLQINWGRVFAARVERQQLSQRRKEEDFEFSAALELGLRDGELRAPQGTLSSRGLEALLRRLTLPVRMVQEFDKLPIPFRAVATNMEDGQQVVVGNGDLALAMRSSMSVPGVFAPIEWNERILGDGGLVNNLPVDIARRMGAEQLIAVNVGTPLSARSSLGSMVGLTGQMINILTEQNVQRSLASLWNEDILITPNLGKLTSADFERGRDFITQGEAAAEALLPRLRELALPEAEYKRWRKAHLSHNPAAPSLEAVAFEGSDNTNPERFKAQLESQAGQNFDPARAERDTRKLASTGDYVRVDYHVEQRAEGDTLVFLMEDKPWGPNYFRVGLDLSTDFAGESSFNLRLSHNRHWLTDHGTEWRNQLSVGQTPRFYSELYHPLIQKLGTSEDWFVSAWTELERRQINIYEPESGKGLARLARVSGQLGFDLGQPWGRIGEVRLGLTHQRWRITPKLLTVDVGDQLNQTWSETGVRLKTVIDQLDFANFPQRGYRLVAEAISGLQSGTNTRRQHFSRFELQGTAAGSIGAHTLNLHARLLQANQPTDSTQGPYTLGGFQQLSGYQQGQLFGNTLAFGRATYYLRLREAPVLTRGFFIGGSLEAGNAWDQRRDASFKDLRYAASAFIGADTGFGPLYLALGHAPRGGTTVYLFIGRP
ncbi:patatin-like phospholipase family protein [Roseateles microcysteis]|uniref:patatin-like phospholipase family protein n=1 Tax=Roseateles microcysteis TaxID=3119057 RepID=UPI002FE57F09